MTWIKFWILTVLVVVNICACGSQARWQRQYDLGMQYLTNGDYEEAIVAFSAAIEIEPNQALAYVGRGGAYIGSGETDVNLTAAMEDYQKALELDDTNEGAYLGAADVYIRRGEFEMAEEILQTGLDKTGSEEIRRKIEEIQSGTIADASGKTRMSSHFENGALIEYWLYDYDEKGNNIRTTCYNADGSWSSTETHSFDANGYMTETILERGMGGQTQEVADRGNQGQGPHQEIEQVIPQGAQCQPAAAYRCQQASCQQQGQPGGGQGKVLLHRPAAGLLLQSGDQKDQGGCRQKEGQ